MPRTWYWLVVALLAAGALTTVGFMLGTGSPGRASWWLGFVPFACWALLPYLGCGLVARRVQASTRALQTALLAALLLSAASIFILYQSFVVHLDPQSGLVFVFLPLWQLVGLVPFGLVANALYARDERAQRA